MCVCELVTLTHIRHMLVYMYICRGESIFSFFLIVQFVISYFLRDVNVRVESVLSH